MNNFYPLQETLFLLSELTAGHDVISYYNKENSEPNI